MEIAVECALEACPIFCVCCWFYLGSVGVPLVLAHFLDFFSFLCFLILSGSSGIILALFRFY